MKLDEDIYKEKADFIKDKLLPLLQAIDGNIMDADYRVLCRSPYDLEYILLHWKNAYIRYYQNAQTARKSQDVIK